MTTTALQPTTVCAVCGHQAAQHIYEEGACRPGWRCLSGCEQFKMPTDTAGSYLSPVGKGGVLAGAPSARRVISDLLWAMGDVRRHSITVTDRCEGCNFAVTCICGFVSHVAGSRKCAEESGEQHVRGWERAIDNAYAWLEQDERRTFTDRAEYERYTTLMEQAEERKS